MRKHFLLLCWCLLLVMSHSEAWPSAHWVEGVRGTPGVRLKQITVTDRAGNPITLYKASHALLIGASAYRHWPQLRGVLADVAAVRAVLEQQGFTVTTVLDPDRVTLLAAFDDFINQYGLDEQNNRLLIYFAGHGYTTKKTMGEMGYIVPVDAPNPTNDLRGFLRFGVDMAQIQVYAQRIDAKHALFVFDSCFSGSLFALSRGTPPVIDYKTANPVRQFITSGSADEEVPDASTFRKQFVSGLGGEADTDRDGYITGKELGMFLEASVINYSNNTQHPQFGTLRNPELDKGDFVFQVVAVEPPPPPIIPARLPQPRGRFSLADLKAKEDAYQRQTEMQAAFDETAAFVGRAEFQREAWTRFLTTYADNNPYSEEDERLRQEATRRQAAVRDEPVVKKEPPRVVVEERQPFEPEMVQITGGTFMMGSPEGEGGDYERPQHEVTVGDFAIGKYEVTRGQFRAFVDATSYKTTAEQGNGCYGWTGSTWEQKPEFNWLNMGFAQEDNHPVACVSWNDAVAYTKWLAKEAGKSYRLPSEAEWEYACRGGAVGETYCGGNDVDSVAWYYGNSGRKTYPVGEKAANRFGLFDMTGNVWEWNQDRWHGSYDGAPTDGSAWESGDSSGRLLRGCSWGSNPDNCRAANRNYFTNPNDPFSGFRVVFLVAGRAF